MLFEFDVYEDFVKSIDVSVSLTAGIKRALYILHFMFQLIDI